MASVEVTTPELRPGLRVLSFVDAGWLYNHNSTANSNKPANDRLNSAGVGLRYASGAYGLSVDWAQVIVGSVLPLSSGSTIPQSGDRKIHLSFTAKF